MLARACWGLAFLVVLIGTMTLNFEQRKQTWAVFALILTFSRIASWERIRQKRSRSDHRVPS